MNIIQTNIVNPLVSLPSGVLTLIVDHLPDAELAKKVSLVCRTFNRVSKSDKLWKKRVIKRYGEERGIKAYERIAIWKGVYYDFLEAGRMAHREKREKAHRTYLENLKSSRLRNLNSRCRLKASL